MAQPSHLNSSEWRIQTMASVESAARYADQSLSNKDDPSKLPRSQDQKVEAPCWLLAKDPSHPLEKRVKWCECIPGSDCVHSSHTFISAVDGTPSVSFSTCIPVQFPVVQGVPQHHLYRSASTVDVLGDRASSACSKAGASNESSERLFLPQQPHPKGSSSEIYMGGNNQRGLGDCRSDTFRELTHYDILQNAKLKADIVSHPLYEQLLAAHVACLRVATPVEHLQTIDAQLTNTHHLAARYSMLSRNVPLVGEEKEELDHFMASYLLLLQSFKDQLQEHVRVHAMEAVVACWELEQVLANLTGVSPGEGSGATMSDDEDEDVETDYSSLDPMLVDGHDSLGFGPLIPTETERSLMERVRQELKLELKQAYRARIADVREEILRKRRAGKLPGETTSILKKWWTAHSKWPYPTEDEKARLVQETGLELKQINNWFINQRKRNWHNHPASSPSSISKSDVISNTAGQASNISLSLNSEISQRPPPSDQHLLQETSSNWASSHRLPSAGVER